MNDGHEYYELKRVTIPATKPGEFRMASAAVRSCGLCAKAISGSGGPGSGSICIECGDLVKKGQARGAIKWDDPSPSTA
jgi:hypothetical protein